MRKICLFLMLLVCFTGSRALAVDYSIYEGTCTVDGDLGDWSGATWIDLATQLDGVGIDLTDAKFAVRWSSDTNLIYVAVTCVDMSHAFIDPAENVGAWNLTDTVEVYIDAADLNKASYSSSSTTQSYWKYAQQYCGGLKTDSSVWCAIAGQDGYNDGTTTFDTNAISTGMIGFAASVDGNTINYEMAINPYSLLNLGDPSTSTIKKLSGGDVIGFDVDLTSFDINNLAYVVMAENSVAGKYLNALGFQTYTLVGTDTIGTDIEFVKIGDPGNAADVIPLYGYDKTAKGAVAYEYYMGKFEITVAQYAEFLNAVATADDANALFNVASAMITRTTNPDTTYTYTVNPGCANRPMGYVTWASTARFCNWLTNGADATSSTETGVYNFNDDGTWAWNKTYSETSPYGINTALRNGTTTPAYWIPDMNEYYKAAYYDSSTQLYYDYATSSDSEPSVEYDGINSGNWKKGGVLTLSAPLYYTEVGTFQNTKSPYGCYDMLGNVWEWTQDFLWGAWVNSVHMYGPTYHGGSYYSSTPLYCHTDYYSGYVANGTAANVYGTTIANADQGMRISCNQAAIDANTQIPGDANGDGAVDVGDLGILAANYGTASGATWELGDFNGDGAVDVGDLGILAANYGTGSSSADFDADYAKVFGTAVEDDTEETTSSICSTLGLPLIAGLALMGLLLVKLEE